MRRFILAALLGLPAPALATQPHHPGPAVVMRMTVEFDYALRNRLADRDGFWFATYELRGHAFPNDPALPALDLFCIGGAWGMEKELGGEEAMCRLSGDSGLLFGRVVDVKDTGGHTTLEFSLYGGRGMFGGFGGRGSAHRMLDFTGERPTGRGTMLLRLALAPSATGAE